MSAANMSAADVSWTSLSKCDMHGAYIPDFGLVYCKHCDEWIDAWDNLCKHFKVTLYEPKRST